MRLVGMLDSPYVRRVAIALQLQGIEFAHQSLSVFRTFDQFRQINPVVKAPSLVVDDGRVLMDSTLILDYAETLPGRRRSLMPTDPQARLLALQTTGLALAACEKAVQVVYERGTRPAEKQHQPWLDRVAGQLIAACRGLEAQMAGNPPSVTSDGIDQPALTAAVAWRFIQQLMPEIVAAADYPALRDLSSRAEQLPEFKAAPHGDLTYPYAS